MPLRQSFIKDQSGAVAAAYAIGITGLIVVAGAAFDYSRIMALDTEMQTAADQAALAAVTQLDQKDGACARAGNAAVELLNNVTLMSNDAMGNEVNINSDTTITVADDACASFAGITFFADDAGNLATTDETAKFVTVTTDLRNARFAFTPLADLFDARTRGRATAGFGSAICQVPPLMICSPTPGTPFDATGYEGVGIEVTRNSGGNTSWAPGIFGFLEVGGGSTGDLVQAIAYGSTNLPCTSTDASVPPETGNAQDLFRAFNTRFDVFDFPDSNGTILSACFNGSCPAASNSVKDLVKDDTSTTGNACKLGNQGWDLPPDDQQFWPLDATTPGLSPGSATVPHHDYSENPGPNLVMGYTRDLCHYDSFGSACAGDRFGNGDWARSDYWTANHNGETQPTGYASMTRYEVYQWELGDGHLPHGPDQRSAPICAASYGATADPLRRVLPVAVVGNCAALNGGANNVVIDRWVNMFLVEPVVNSRDNTSVSNVIYMEVIGPVDLGSGAGGNTNNFPFRRDTAYLLE